MKRFFGTKDKQPAVSLDEATKNMDVRVNSLDEKIKKLDQELFDLKGKMQKTRPGTSTHNMLKQKALKVLKQKKMYEQQRDTMANQQFNMEQTNFGIQSVKDSLTTVNAMKSANVSLKQELKKIDIDDVENMQDDLSDLLQDNNEIQEALGRSYGVGEVDETELEDELAALGDELEFETPSYLSAVPTTEPGDQTAATPQLSAPLSN